MPSPFTGAEPHPLAVRAASELKAHLKAHGDSLPHNFHAPHGGKMFGVLVASDASGRVGYLTAFSGLLDREWLIGDFAPPVFDLPAMDAFWPAEREEIYRLNRAIEALQTGSERRALRTERAEVETRWAADWAELRRRHKERKRQRHVRRAHWADQPPSDEAKRALAALAAESWDDESERGRFKKAKRHALSVFDDAIAALDARQAALSEERARRCAESQRRILNCYQLENFRGETAMLEDFFAPHPPSGGAGDCAAPKLLAHARRLALVPLALAEFWWGQGSADGGRQHGAWYPACRSKCEPILPWMLRGVAVQPTPLWGSAASRDAEPATVYEDEYLVVVHKPAGLLSVPGRTIRLDSVQARLAKRYPTATGPLLVHRLDLDTSGLLVMARSLDAYRALQRLFVERKVEKRYVAVLEGRVEGERGRIELPLRLDYERSPRQMVDSRAGKPADTRWEVLVREESRTRVAFYPETGRTHQLRVHAAHPDGLGCPIVGDPLYGRAGARMLLHAESLRFIHPFTRRDMVLEAPAPF